MATKTKGAKRGRPSRRGTAKTRPRQRARRAHRVPQTRIQVETPAAGEDVLEEEIKEDVEELESDHGPQRRMGGYGGFFDVPQ